MNIKSIGIIGGTGGLGARFETYFKLEFPELKVLVSGRKTCITNIKIVQECDVVIFAVPINQTLSVIKQLIPYARPDQIWTDFTSIKQQPVEIMLRSKAQVCGLHPLFGSLPEIEHQTLIYCPARIEPDNLAALLKLFAAFNLMKFSPQEHDALMGVVQCASHMSDMVMGETLRQSGFDFATIWQVSSPSYRLKLEVMGRMFAQSPDLYADIATQNLSAPQFTNLFKEASDHLETIVLMQDREALLNIFKSTKHYLTSKFCERAYADSQHFLTVYTSENNGNQGQTDIDSDVNTKRSPVHLAVFGEPGSHTDQASTDFNTLIGTGECQFYDRIFKLLEAINSGQAQWGIMPYENTTEGSVLEVLDELMAYPDLRIVAATDRSIKQYLMTAQPIKLNAIERIYSHPQALAQSKNFLRQACPQATFEVATSTAQAARRVKQALNQPWAAVGAKELATSFGLNLISGNMASVSNRTRFVLIKKKGQVPVSHVSCVAFWFTSDQAGNLASVLNYFSEQQINLLKLDTRRATPDKGEYIFYVDAAISLPDFMPHLEVLKRQVAGLHLLGSY